MNELRSTVRGRVWLPGDPDFDQARRPWNLAVDQPAAAVVEAADADDVAALVRYAGSRGFGIAIQPNGHGASGHTDGLILLRTGRLDTLHIDPQARRARIGAGVPSGKVQAAAAPHGLTGLPGSSPVVSVTGVALGGGLSWFGRKHGWVADSVTAFEVVDANGEQRHVTAGSDPDLFWALRGGGGDFAIVTALELTLHPAPRLHGGRVIWAGEHAPAVLAAYRELTTDAPDGRTAWLDLVNFPGAEPMVALDLTCLDVPEVSLDHLPPPISDTRRPISVAELGPITGEPTDPSAGYARGELLTAFDQPVIDALLAEPIAPLLTVQIRHLGGAFTQPSDSPHGPLTEPYAVYLFALPSDPAAITARQRSLISALPVSGRKPFTFLSPPESAADAFTPPVLDRLRAIKKSRDPGNVFRSNYPVSA
jgi:hypothetical protein